MIHNDFGGSVPKCMLCDAGEPPSYLSGEFPGDYVSPLLAAAILLCARMTRLLQGALLAVNTAH